MRSTENRTNRLFAIIGLLTAFVVFSSVVSAQSKKRIGLPEGADSVEVTGKITGKQYAIYEIRAEKGDTWSVDLDSPNKYIGYTVKGPNGDRYDFLEKTQSSGLYLIRVELNSTGSRSKKPANFTLNIKF